MRGTTMRAGKADRDAGVESKPIARKVRTSAPSMPAGSIVWVEIKGQWLKARVDGIEFAVLHSIKLTA